ncbi:MAG: hypothetical protein IT497_03470 [Ottowia sp.]|nr:hypothetical protein [Ottowia sp.]
MNFSASLAHAGPTALPLPLVEAQFLCFQKTAVMDLKKTARSVLSGILAFVSVRTPSKKIWPKRETLRVQCRLNSDASLYRGLAELEQKGYVSREEQLHHARNGRFHISRIGLTEKAINLLNLGDKKLIHNSPSCKMGDGHIKNLVKSSTSKEESPQEEISGKTNREILKQTFHEIDPETKLPKPLLKLTTLGLTPKTICWLMREAKQHQKRLEDVMNYAWGYLEPIAAKGSSNIKAYLRALIGKNQDFAFLLKQEKNNIENEMALVFNKNKREHIIKNQQGYYLIDKNNHPLGKVEGQTIRWFPNHKTGNIERWTPIWGIDFSETNKIGLQIFPPKKHNANISEFDASIV